MFKQLLNLTITIIFSIFLLSEVQATEKCQGKLLNGHSLDSQAFVISDIYQGLDIEGEISGSDAELLVGFFIESLQCLTSEKGLVALELKGTCRNIERGNFLSKTCFVNSRIGYFLLTFDMMEGAHLIFNRFD